MSAVSAFCSIIKVFSTGVYKDLKAKILRAVYLKALKYSVQKMYR